jgi:serine protease inhibitor
VDVTLRPGVAASNALTARWVGACGDRPGNFVLSGAAVWPLLAILAAGAEEPIRSELELALGLSPPDAVDEAVRMLADLDEGDARAALGVWIRDRVALDPEWLARLPAEQVIGRLSGEPAKDRDVVDAWVHDKTAGILDELPIELDEHTRMVLAQAIALKTTWTDPFTPFFPSPTTGPWSHIELPGLIASIEDLDRVVVLDTPVGQLTTFRAKGSGSVDVHLIIAADAVSTGDVLTQAIEHLLSSEGGRRGSELAIGQSAPGLVVRLGWVDEGKSDELHVQTVRFDVASTHDLLGIRDIFGLATAAELEDFAGISAELLMVQSGVQSARARFTDEGFEAAAASAFALRTLGKVLPSHEVKVLDVSFDRPFGFLAIDRNSGLVLFAGWLQDPAA